MVPESIPAISAFTVTQGPGEEGGRHQLLIGEKIEQGNIKRGFANINTAGFISSQNSLK